MADDVKFDFAKAQSLLDILNECSQRLMESSNLLGNEVNDAGQWWKGESYDAFKAKYSETGKSKATIEALTDRTGDLMGYLSKVSSAKKELERNSSKLFM